MKVSILITLYNAEKYIAETLENALAQTWADKEIIVVDDGSTDNSLKIAKSYENEILKVYSQKNKGACFAINFATSIAKGDYIQYLDHDDLMQPNKIEVQMNCILKNNLGKNDVVYSYMEIFENNINNLRQSTSFANKSYGKQFDSNTLDFQNDMLLSKRIVCPFQYLLSREIVEKVGGWNEQLFNSMDVEFFTKIMEAADNIIYVEGTKCYYRATPGSMSKKFTPKDCEYRLQALISMASIMLKNNYSDNTVNALSSYFAYYITDWFPGNKHTLKPLERFMKENRIPHYKKKFSKKHKFLINILGWRQTFLLKRKIKSL